MGNMKSSRRPNKRVLKEKTETKRFRKVTYLLIILVCPIVYGAKLITYANSQTITTAPRNLLKLIREGYDLVNDSSAFSNLCISLNDSLLLQSNSMKMAVFTDINFLDSKINWCLWPYSDDYELLKISDRYFFNIDLYKGAHIKVQNAPVQLSNIRSLAIDYIFYPDSISRKRIFIKRNISCEEEIEISGVGAYMKVHIKDNNGFLVSDWRVFYNCLHELVKLFDEERNTIALKIWNKDYNSLSFEEKAKIVDLVGYRINIEFK